MKLTKPQKQLIKSLEQLFNINSQVLELENQLVELEAHDDKKGNKLFEKRLNALERLSEKVLDLELLFAGE